MVLLPVRTPAIEVWEVALLPVRTPAMEARGWLQWAGPMESTSNDRGKADENTGNGSVGGGSDGQGKCTQWSGIGEACHAFGFLDLESRGLAVSLQP